MIRENNISDGDYIEPYAGGAGIAWELLVKGVVRRVAINDLSTPVYSFWHSVFHETNRLCSLIERTPITVKEWCRQKEIVTSQNCDDALKLGFAFLFINRTNRSGIINAGVIGGKKQEGRWKIDARFNKKDLIARIETIARYRARVTLSNLDAMDFVKFAIDSANSKTLLYLDPPYFEKGRFLYHDAYSMNDHAVVADTIQALRDVNWIVSYDDVPYIRELYANSPWLRYGLSYSAGTPKNGTEVMYFNPNLRVPQMPLPIREMARYDKISASP